ncbi:TSCPD domain-containing protein [Geotalea toluenoxydans]|uniref:TSCPD domain-containing protein n=1 Tax=Geotalea toluenoxydans TaxID=421624 RepID=UPI000AA15301|nr:TSCPD domain-containing protein [Geotalea toluenoxydans]
MQTGCGPLYVTVNEDKSGLFELFTTMGKAGGCAASQSEAIGRMVSLAWRSGIQARQVIKQLLGISCHCPAGFGENKVLSCADAVAKAIQAHMQESGIDMGIEQAAFDRGACPECGGIVEHERMRRLPGLRLQRMRLIFFQRNQQRPAAKRAFLLWKHHPMLKKSCLDCQAHVIPADCHGTFRGRSSQGARSLDPCVPWTLPAVLQNSAKITS